MLDNNASFEFMTLRMREIAERILLEMAEDVRRSFTAQTGRTTPVTQFSAPVSIGVVFAPSTSIVTGLQWATNTWARRETLNMGSTRTFLTNTGGIFAFSEQNVNLHGLTTLPNSQTLLTIILQYGLDDFIGRDEAFNINGNATVLMVTGVAARLAGAPAGSDPIAWMRGRGYIVPTRPQSAAATQQEMAYLMMAMYEMRTGTRVDAMRISNFGLTANMGGIDPRFLRSVQGGLELGFIPTSFNPAGTPTVGDLLRMVEAMNRRMRF